ncbi:MAG TPA: subclass B1 metallo-beta-lactamase [Arachidicoccus sp.]|nr:subclass B1 metallo-beta-lactamase [Arachidicoccus sp.]
MKSKYVIKQVVKCSLWMICLGWLMTSTVNAQLAKKGEFKIQRVTDSVYLFTSYGEFNGRFYPANGLFALTNKGAIIVDGPWDPKDYQPLLDSIWLNHHQKVILCLATHFHGDRTGALAYYRQKGIETYSTKQTDSLSIIHHMNRAAHLMPGDTTFQVGGFRLETYYPGPGHAPDNIVVWFPREKILYGGCLYKSIDDHDLGNLSDANISAWPKTIRRVQMRFGKPRYMIVGHGNWHSLHADTHTIQLAQKYLKQKKTQ